jgi:anaerobic magnesium-protoporphyrin IX monomethyl ester cyclase
VMYCRDRDDYQVIVDLLRYDWLRCGFRKLPQSLACRPEEEEPDKTRNILFAGLPETLNGVFINRERNTFFKRSVFLRLNDKACSLLGIEHKGQGRRVGILAEREKSLHSHNRVIILPDIPAD